MKSFFCAIIGVMIVGQVVHGQVVYNSSQQSGCASCSGSATNPFPSLPTTSFPAAQDQVFYNNTSVSTGYNQFPMESYAGNSVVYPEQATYSQVGSYYQNETYPQGDVYSTSYPTNGVVSSGISSTSYGYVETGNLNSGAVFADNGLGVQDQVFVGEVGNYNAANVYNTSSNVVYPNESPMYNEPSGINEIPQATFATNRATTPSYPITESFEGSPVGTFTSNRVMVSSSPYELQALNSPTYSNGTSAYSNRQSQPISTGADAQYKAQQAASMMLKGHVGGGLCQGAKFEGVGWSNGSAQDAIQQCCYWGTRPVAQIGTYRGQDGLWYACVMYY